MKPIKRIRPYIPLKVRVEVAERQAKYYADPLWWKVYCAAVPRMKLKNRLRNLLEHLFGGPVHLDHDPALILRLYDPVTKTYIPDANDPDYLIYRGVEDHLEKTVGRKVGALKTVTTKGSDVGLAKKFRRIDAQKLQMKNSRIFLENIDKQFKPKHKIPSRPFPKTKRKIQSRGFHT